MHKCRSVQLLSNAARSLDHSHLTNRKAQCTRMLCKAHGECRRVWMCKELTVKQHEQTVDLQSARQTSDTEFGSAKDSPYAE